ncbi:hypothetical protein CPB83DRAFT_906852 [Crepidotus variabilis]|uniref:Uncharacterized protein n=1 Tax=Crepidotus variabilis TaxID=179855 RepID=A0A9P6EG26_9AGAR|nr:hypothetical protein CPB83DRAFT_906852 [Crepidotus variabilis]
MNIGVLLPSDCSGPYKMLVIADGRITVKFLAVRCVARFVSEESSGKSVPPLLGLGIDDEAPVNFKPGSVLWNCLSTSEGIPHFVPQKAFNAQSTCVVYTTLDASAKRSLSLPPPMKTTSSISTIDTPSSSLMGERVTVVATITSSGGTTSTIYSSHTPAITNFPPCNSAALALSQILQVPQPPAASTESHQSSSIRDGTTFSFRTSFCAFMLSSFVGMAMVL